MRSIAGSVSETVGNVMGRQVASVARAAGYCRRVAWCKPFLSKAAVRKQLAWARENGETDWRLVLWTDEVRLELGERPGRVFVTRKPGEEFLPVNVQPTFKSGRNSIMLWGCIAHGWKGPLIRLELGEKHGDKAQGGKGKGGLTGTQYVKQVMEGPLWAS